MYSKLLSNQETNRMMKIIKTRDISSEERERRKVLQKRLFVKALLLLISLAPYINDLILVLNKLIDVITF